MERLKAVNITRQTVLAEKVRSAVSLSARAIGLLGTPTLPASEGLWITPCSSVHTFLMRYPIDVLFLDADGRVLHARTMVPWRMSRWVSGSRGALELAAGTLARTQTGVGDRIALRKGD